MTFKYPLGAEVAVKLRCDHGETHRISGMIVAMFKSAGPQYVVETENKGNPGNLWIVDEGSVVGRINMRPKKEAPNV